MNINSHAPCRFSHELFMHLWSIDPNTMYWGRISKNKDKRGDGEDSTSVWMIWDIQFVESKEGELDEHDCPFSISCSVMSMGASIYLLQLTFHLRLDCTTESTFRRRSSVSLPSSISSLITVFSRFWICLNESSLSRNSTYVTSGYEWYRTVTC